MSVGIQSAVKVDRWSLENFRMTTPKYAWNAVSKPETTTGFSSFSGAARSQNRASPSIWIRLREFGGTELINPT